MKVLIESITVGDTYRYERELTRVSVDGQELCTGSYGGEPEDNSRRRDYRWVEPLLQQLSARCGAEVELKHVKLTEEEGEDL
jgi:hypothetical protein